MNGLEQPTCAPPAPPPACRKVLPTTRLVRLHTAQVDLLQLLEAGGGRPSPTGQTELGLGQQPWRSTMGLNPWGLLREWPGQRNAWCSAEALHESLAQGLVRRALSARQGCLGQLVLACGKGGCGVGGAACLPPRRRSWSVSGPPSFLFNQPPLFLQRGEAQSGEGGGRTGTPRPPGLWAAA